MAGLETGSERRTLAREVARRQRAAANGGLARTHPTRQALAPAPRVMGSPRDGLRARPQARALGARSWVLSLLIPSCSLRWVRRCSGLSWGRAREPRAGSVAIGFGPVEHPDGADHRCDPHDDGVSGDHRVQGGGVPDHHNEQWGCSHESHEDEAQRQPGTRTTHFRRSSLRLGCARG
jgi:hypothetical protein